MICAVVGDSIAEMVQHYLPQCEHNTKIGISSTAVIARTPSGKDVVIVSAGSNDPDNPNLRKNLEVIQKRGGHIIWILPVAAWPRALVTEVAAEHGEPVVGFEPARDHVHPRRPDKLAAEIDKIMRK
jgi:hypothetical protein